MHKISRLTRFEKQGVLQRPYIAKVYKHQLSKTHIAHHGVINCFVDVARKMGKEVQVIPEDELKLLSEEQRKSLCDNVNLIVSMGGDHTFLKSQALVWDKSIPIVGINTNRDVFTGALNTQHIDFGQKEEQTTELLEQMDDDSCIWFEKRSRILFERQPSHSNRDERQMICLNETMTAEKDIASASRFTIEKDGRDIGLFKSSGLIIATGTGSTGWLYSVRSITPHQIAMVQDLLGSVDGHTLSKLNVPLSQKLSDETVFPRDADKMYYCVREGFSFTTGESEGFCKHIKVTAEMINGQAIVDGWFSADLSLGDTFTLTADPKYALKVMNIDI